MEQSISQNPSDRIKALPGIRHEINGLLSKRLLDVLLTILSFPILLPLMGMIAILIKLDSRGPVIFRQKRVGMRAPNGEDRSDAGIRFFTVYKFRTMHVDSESDIHRKFMQAYIAGDRQKMASLQPDAQEGEAFKLHKDPRVTRVGHYLRKLSLDELPQIFNVIKGDMSLVGPRPAIPYEVEMYSPESMRRLDTLPGITGLWQVSGRTTTSFDQMVRLDVEYIEKQSLWLDLKIIFLTLPAVISKKGAG